MPRSWRVNVTAAPRIHNSPTPMKKIAGMNFQLAVSVLSAMTPHAIQTRPVAASISGDDGRLPTWGSWGSGVALRRSGRRALLTPASYRPTTRIP